MRDEPEDWLRHVVCSPLNGRGNRQKVAIIGNSQLDKAERPPFDDPAWDVWCCNSLWGLCHDREQRFRADCWFELHPLSVQTPQELVEMYDCPVPLYVLQDPAELATGRALREHWIPYPLDAVRQRFGNRDFFTCTMCYQMALALLQGYRTIGLWGLELWQGSARERTAELRGLEYWIGVAKGMGVEIVLPAYSCLAWHPYLYGFDYYDEADYTQEEVAATVEKFMEERARKFTDVQQAALKHALVTLDADLKEPT